MQRQYSAKVTVGATLFLWIWEWLPNCIPVRFGMVTAIRDGCPKFRGCIPDRSKNFSLHQSSQNGPVFHTACYSMATWNNFPKGESARREDDHSAM